MSLLTNEIKIFLLIWIKRKLMNDSDRNSSHRLKKRNSDNSLPDLQVVDALHRTQLEPSLHPVL
jgi:hypothetical protein